MFRKKYEGISFPDDGQVVDTKGEKKLFGGEEETTRIYSLDEYTKKVANRRGLEFEQDKQAMEEFGNVEDVKLTNTVEQSSDPEKGKKLKKALKAMTIGALMLASTLGGFNNAKATSDFLNSKAVESSVTMQQQEISDMKNVVGDLESEMVANEISVESMSNPEFIAHFEKVKAKLMYEIDTLSYMITVGFPSVDMRTGKTTAGEGIDAPREEDYISDENKYVSSAEKLTNEERQKMTQELQQLQNAADELEKVLSELASINYSIKL